MSYDQSEGSGYEAGGFQQVKNESPPQSRVYDGGNSNNNSRANSWNNTPGYKQNSGSGNFHKFNRGPGNRRDAPPRDFTNDPPILYRPYFGTGNAEAPPETLETLKELSGHLASKGYTVRTSAFDGPDKIFSQNKHREIILPWRNFANHESKLTFTSEEAKYFAKQFFANYDNVKDTVKTFLAKNIRLICGQNLKSPAQFGLIWTEEGAEKLSEVTRSTGNMKHLISVAEELRIPIFNAGKPNVKDRLYERFSLN